MKYPVVVFCVNYMFILHFFRRISDTLGEQLPSLESLILTGNQMQELGDLDPLLNLKNLNTVSLLYNPVTSRPHYRLYLIYKLPQLRLLDFQKIKQKVKAFDLFDILIFFFGCLYFCKNIPVISRSEMKPKLFSKVRQGKKFNEKLPRRLKLLYQELDYLLTLKHPKVYFLSEF